MAWKAFSNANRLEEQAVSMAVLGPEDKERSIIFRAVAANVQDNVPASSQKTIETDF